MDKYLMIKSGSKGKRKRFKYFKPFWNEELTDKWKYMKNKEKYYILLKIQHKIDLIKQNLNLLRPEEILISF
jgi:hypothetical protein